jgi:hypothetical protein
VKDKLINIYHLTKSTYSDNFYSGEYEIDFLENMISISDFKLGDKTVKLYLFFNNNSKFYRFEFDCDKYSANYFDTKVKEDAQFLSEIFEKKYGPPKYKYSPDFFDIKEGNYSFYWKWWRPYHTIFTAISTNESEYYSSAIIYDDVLEKEQKIEDDQNKQKSIEKAIDSF